MPNFFGNILKGFFGQSDIPDQARFSANSVLEDVSALSPKLAAETVAFNRATALPMERLAREVEDIYDPNQGQLREQTTKSILDELGLGGQLPQDVQEIVLRNAFSKGGMSGIGGSQMGRNLAARDLGLTSLDLLNQRIGRAASYTRSAPRPFQERSFLTPGNLAQTQISGTEAANQADAYSASLRSQNNQNVIKSLGNLAGYIVAGAMGGPGASIGPLGGGIGGMFSKIPMGGMTGIPASMG